MRNTEERLRKRREKRAHTKKADFEEKRKEAKKKEKIQKRRGRVCDDDVTTRALVLVHTHTYIHT